MFIKITHAFYFQRIRESLMIRILMVLTEYGIFIYFKHFLFKLLVGINTMLFSCLSLLLCSISLHLVELFYVGISFRITPIIGCRHHENLIHQIFRVKDDACSPPLNDIFLD